MAKIITVGMGTPTQRDYVNGFEYYTDFETNFNRLEHFPMDEGRMRPTTPGGTTYRYELDLKDHLGNTRMTLADANNNGIFDNYSFGMRITRKLSSSENTYTYNGKEHENDFGLNWFHNGARYYDPNVGRWWAVDPADELSSPFEYARNNVIQNTDHDGRRVFVGTSLYVNDEFRQNTFNYPAFKIMIFIFGKGGPLEKYDVYLGEESNPHGGKTKIWDQDYALGDSQNQILNDVGNYQEENKSSSYQVTGAENFAFALLFDVDHMDNNVSSGGVSTVNHEVNGHLYYMMLAILNKEKFEIGGNQ